MKRTKKIIFLALVCLIAAGAMMSCTRNEPAAAGARVAATDGPFPGKIAIITNTIDQNEEEVRSAEQLVRKYGADKVIHALWPVNFMAEQEQMVTTVARIADDPDIKALIINQAVPGTMAAVDKLLETRDDIFIVLCTPQENPPDVARRSNLIFNINELDMGEPMVMQAKSQGATTFVHYSFPRHMSIVMLAARRDAIRQTCEREGLLYVDATAPDPTGDAGVTGAQQFILEDVPRMVERYGTDTAFFSTNCAMQIPLITGVMNTKAIYPQPCCPSPFHGFPTALGLEAIGLDVGRMVAETRKVAEENGMLGRLSTYPVPLAMTFTNVGAEYAIKWINGEVSKTSIDDNVLLGCFDDYVIEMTGASIAAQMISYSENNAKLDNFKLVMMDYLTY